jgi:uncharacterized protein YutE (UPF0331/DUF86 family)
MINKTFVEEKISLILRDLNTLQEFQKMTFSQVAQDAMKYGALKNFLMEIIGRAIDINEHLIANLFKPKMDTPKSYKETFLAIGELGILPEDFAQKISKSAGFRNAIVHEYNNLDKGIVYKSVGEALDQYNQYCIYIMDFLEKNKQA